MPTTYPPLSIGAKRRLAIFKQEATGRQWSRPMTWRDVRFATLESPTGMAQGFNSVGRTTVPVWYCHGGKQFRNERFAHEIAHLDHTGWYGDTENAEKLHRGIVGSLPHGRFIAGYETEDNGERVYFGEIFNDEDEAAHMADEHARVAAESEDEYSQRWNEAQRLDSLIEDKRTDVEKSFALRNHPRIGRRERDWTREVIADIRAFQREREALKVD